MDRVEKKTEDSRGYVSIVHKWPCRRWIACMAIRLHVLERGTLEVMQHDPACIILWLLVAVTCHDRPFAVAHFIEGRAIF